MPLCTHALKNCPVRLTFVNNLYVLGQEQTGNVEVKIYVGHSDYIIMKLWVDIS